MGDSSQPELFGEIASETPTRMGSADVTFEDAGSILTRASGFMGDYDFTLNPYSGCSFGCTYCYAAFFARDRDLQERWGEWVKVKRNAIALLRRMRTDLCGKSIYMSSVTDPYQPIERRLRLVRELLEVLKASQPRLVVQTRSPLVTRDIDLFREFDSIQVNMTVTTDSEEVRRAFEPRCPTNTLRLAAIAEVGTAGIDAGITMTPLLPIADAEAFAASLQRTGVKRFVVQPFHPERGKFVGSTRGPALEISRQLGWDSDRYRQVVRILGERLPSLVEGREGFAPT